jgi:D-alanyl-D-alanine carboxypeptidase
MRVRTKRRATRFLKRRILTILILFVVFGSFVGVNIRLQGEKNQEIQATIQESERLQAELTQKIDEIIAARKAAEEKARKEAAAKKTAQDVISGADAKDIDPATCNLAETHKNPGLIDVLVNKKHCIQPLTFSPGDLTTVYGATISNKAAGDFAAMYEAARAANQPFTVTSSYRSYSTQVSTYNYWVSVSGKAGADTYSARPGYSEHQTGFAVDLASTSGCSLDCFGTTSQYQWLQANAAKYGFIQRYYAGHEATTGYKAEEWHYRYVGKTVALDMKKQGIKTLEAYWGFAGGGYY